MQRIFSSASSAAEEVARGRNPESLEAAVLPVFWRFAERREEVISESGEMISDLQVAVDEIPTGDLRVAWQGL